MPLWRPQFRLQFRDAAELARYTAGLLVSLAEIDMEQLQLDGFPELYKSGVRYRQEGARKRDEWADARTVFARGWGDCEDLVAIRLAELWLQHGTPDVDFVVKDIGPKLEPQIFSAEIHPGVFSSHVAILLRRAPDGASELEDPSVELGMPLPASYEEARL